MDALHLFLERNGYWYIYIPASLSLDGRMHRYSTGTRERRQAERELSRQEERIARHQTGRSEALPFGRFLKDYLAVRAAEKHPSTVEIDQQVLPRFFSSCGVATLDRINRQHIERHLAELASSGLAPATVDVHRRHIRRALQWAVEMGTLTHNPAAAVKPRQGARKGRRRAYTDEELQRIFAHVGGDRRHRMLWLFLLHSGARLSETLAIRRDHVQGDHLEIRQAKGGRTRSIPITIALQRVLGQSTDAPYFFGGIAPFADRNVVYRHFRRHLDRLGISGTIHAFRATYITRALESGVPVSTLAHLVGATPEVIRRHYFDPSDPHLAREAERIHFELDGPEVCGILAETPSTKTGAKRPRPRISRPRKGL